ARKRASSDPTKVRIGQLVINPVGVEKVTELTLVSTNPGTYKQSRVADALDRHTRRLAAYDGTTPPFGVAVLLLPHRRSGSREPSVTSDRPTRQLCVCGGEAARFLQRNRPAIDRSGSAVAHSVAGVFVWHYERAAAGRRIAHAPGLGLVHRTGLR